MKKLIFSFCLIFSILSCVTFPQQKNDDFKVIGYLPWYRFRTVDLDNLSGLSHVIIFSLVPDFEGNIVKDNINSRGNVKEISIKLRRLGISPLVCIAGWADTYPFKDVVVDDVKRTRLAEALANYCLDNNLDGIDFDWEFPKTQEQKDGYANLIIETKALLPGKTISIAMSSTYSFGTDEENARVFDVVDWVGIMSYDRGGPHSLYADSLKDIKTFQKKGVADSKIILGLPFYGRNIKQFSNTKTYTQIHSASTYLSPTQDYFIEDESEAVFFFNGKNTILRKLETAYFLGLGGVMIWELGQDSWLPGKSITREILWNVENFKH